MTMINTLEQEKIIESMNEYNDFILLTGGINMAIEMKPEIKKVLDKINFIDRYQKMSERFRGNPNDLDDRLGSYNNQKVIEVFKL